MRKMTPMANCYGMELVLVQEAVAQGLPFLLGEPMTRDLRKVSWATIDLSLVDPSKLGHPLQVARFPRSCASSADWLSGPHPRLDRYLHEMVSSASHPRRWGEHLSHLPSPYLYPLEPPSLIYA